MKALNLISHTLEPIKTSNTGQEALDQMSDNNVRHLPIVNNKQLLGVISEEDILEHDLNEPIGSYRLSLQRPFVKDTDHIFDLMAQIARLGLTLIPVVDEEDQYMGVICQESLLEYFSGSFSFSERGSIIVLEMSKPDYALSEISRVVESEGVAIISAFISSQPDTNKIYVHLKINKTEVGRVLAALERYEYVVHSMYTEEQDSGVLKDRFESFMHYLNV